MAIPSGDEPLRAALGSLTNALEEVGAPHTSREGGFSPFLPPHVVGAAAAMGMAGVERDARALLA